MRRMLSVAMVLVAIGVGAGAARAGGPYTVTPTTVASGTVIDVDVPGCGSADAEQPGTFVIVTLPDGNFSGQTQLPIVATISDDGQPGFGQRFTLFETDDPFAVETSDAESGVYNVTLDAGTYETGYSCENGEGGWPVEDSVEIELLDFDASVDQPAGGDPPTTDPPETTGGDEPVADTSDLPHDRAAISTSVRPVDAEGVGAPEYLVALLIATAVALLLVFPSALFNSTLEEHYDEVVGWFRWARRGRATTSEGDRQDDASTSRPLVFLGVTLVAALLYGFLDPNFGFDRASLAQYIGVAASMLVLTLLGGALSAAYLRRRDRAITSHFEAFPWVLAVALLCVLVSRILDFQPGYLYGLIGGLAVSAELSKQEDGKSKAIAALALLGVSLVAWFAWTPVADAASESDPAFVTIMFDGLLGAIVVAGVEGLVLGLIPLRFLPGETVVAWSRRAWIALFGAGLFLYAHLLVRPAVGDDTAPGPSVATAIGLFVGFGLVSVAFWGYFRVRKQPEPADDSRSTVA